MPMDESKQNLYVLSGAIFLASLSWNQIIPFLPLFMWEMGVEHRLLDWVGVVYALQSAAGIVALPLWGKLADRYGRKPMAVRAGLCLSSIYFGMSFCRTPLELAVLRFLNGALTGFIPSSMALIAANTPEERTPQAVATAQTASAVGLILGPAIGGVLASAVGYRASMHISGAVVLLSTVLVWLLVQEKDSAPLTAQTGILEDLLGSFKSRVLTSVMLTVFLYGLYIASVGPLLALYLTEMGGSVSSTGLVLSMPPLAVTLTAHLWVRLGKTWGYHRIIQVGLLGASASAVLLMFVSSVQTFASVFFVAGVFLAALYSSAAAVLCTRVRVSIRGQAYGMQQSATMIGTLVGPLVATRIASSFGVPWVFLFLAIMSLVGVAFFSRLAAPWEEAEPLQ